MSAKEAKGLSLESFLIKPVQRICKYPLLIKEIAKYTLPTLREKEILLAAENRFQQVINLVNNIAREMEARERNLDIASRIECAIVIYLRTV